MSRVKTKTSQNSLRFEELEPRLLFSADGAEALATPAVEQDFNEEPIVTADMEASAVPEVIEVEQPIEQAAPIDVNTSQEVVTNENASDQETSVDSANEDTAGDNLTAEQGTQAADQEQQTTSTEKTTGEEQDTTDEPIITTVEDNTAPSNENDTSQVLSEEPATTELVLINDNIYDQDTSLNDIRNSVEEGHSVDIVVLDSHEDGIEQVTQVLQEYDGLDAIHIISHGNNGRFALGSDWLDNADLLADSDAITVWGDSLTEDADILLYGCNIAADEDGQTLTNTLAGLTGADVAASDDATGSAALGGDWALEYDTGSIETNIAISSAAQADYEGVLTAFVVDTTNDSGAGSLRQAIIDANASANAGGPDVITFDIGADGSQQTITLSSALDPISEAVTIDGFSQYGALTPTTPLIIIDGNGGAYDGFDIASSGSTIQGLVINNFRGSGIWIHGVNATNNIIQGNYIGTNAAGTAQVINTGTGIAISDGAGGNIIGGSGTGEGNVISGNGDHGIGIWDAGSDDNVIQGNYIGTDAAGTGAIGNNGTDGINIWAASNTIIGGSNAGEGNVISANAEGIFLDNSDNNIIKGNYIGTDYTGTSDLGNGYNGILIQSGADNNTIGGSGAGEGNLISGNESYGINIQGDTGNSNMADGNIIQGNFIGTDINGTVDLGNTLDGIALDYVTNTQIGGSAGSIGTIGSAAFEGNLISGNRYGINVSHADSTGNTVQGNYIGTDVTGTAVLGNDYNGVLIQSGADTNTIGGSGAGEGNLISGNGFYGIGIQGDTSSSNTSDGNIIQGNFIGTDISGTVDLGNSLDGIYLNYATNTQLGGSAGSIGAIGSAAFEGNLISGNRYGINISNADSTGNKIQGNWIGFGADGSNLGNSYYGISIGADVSGNLIGGTATGTGNRIGNSSWDGIVVAGGAGTGNSLLGNTIVSNGELGIDLGNDGVSANDIDDADTGVNGLQNFPVITSAVTNGTGNITISGSLNTNGLNQTYRIEFFAGTTQDGSSHGEAEQSLGFITVTTDGTGNSTFCEGLSATVAVGDFITATATVELVGGSYGDTSEFAQNVTAGTGINISGRIYTDEGVTPIADGATARLIVNGVNAGSGTTKEGAYSIASGSPINAGDSVLVYIDNNDGDVNDGTTVTVSNGSDLADLDIYVGHIITRHDNGGSLTNALMSTAISSFSDAEILYSISGGDLIASTAGTEIYVPTGHEFAPAGNLTADNVEIQGTFTGGANTYSVAANWDAATGTFTANNSLLSITPNASGYLFTPGASSYYDVTIDGNGKFYDLGGNLTVTNDFTLRDSGGVGTFTVDTNDIDTNNFIWESGYYSFSAGADIFVSGAFSKTGGGFFSGANGLTITFDGNGNSVFTPDGTALGNIVVSKDNQGASVTLGADLTLVDSSSLDIASGIFDIAGNNLDTGTGSTFSNTGTIRLQGGETVTNLSNDVDSGTVVYNGTSSYSGLVLSDNYNNLEFANAGGSWTLDNPLDVNGNFTINSGTLDVDNVNNYQINVAGDWSNSGTFTAQGATVIFDGGDQTINGSTTFYNFTKTESSNDATDVTLTFDNTTTQTINGTLILDGLDDDDRINLISDSPTSQWELVLGAAATKNIDYVEVTDSDASGSDASQLVINPANSIDGGNNIDWFNNVVIGPVTDSNSSPNTVAEDAIIGTVVEITALATDPDSADTVTYSLSDDAGGLFAIDANSGVITVANALDYETASSHSVTVLATSSDTSSNSQEFTIQVTDVNESAVGAVSDNNTADNTVTEDAANGTVVDITALATDADGTDTVTYSLSDDAGGLFAIDANSGVITVANALDYETATSHSITVLATSSDASTSSQEFTIQVTDVNDAPILTAIDNQFVDELNTLGFTVTATDTDLPVNTLIYSLDATSIAAGMTIDANTGDFSWTPAEGQTGVYIVTVTITDDGTSALSDSETFSVNVNEVNIAPVTDNTGTGSEDDLADTSAETIIVFPPVEETLQDLENEEEKVSNNHDIQVPDFDSAQPVDQVYIDNDTQTEKATRLTVNPGDTEPTTNISPISDTSKTSDYQHITQHTSSTQFSRHTGQASKVLPVKNENYTSILLKAFRIATQETLDFIVPPVSAAPVYLESPDPGRFMLKNEAMSTQLDVMHQEMDQSFEQSKEEHQIMVYMTSGMTISFAAGVMSYMLRAGSLMASFLSTVPLWKSYDPVAVLVAPRKKHEKNTQRNEPHPVSATEQKAEDMFTGKGN